MLWVTRAGGNVDRVACPWLIKRFIDKEAQFLYVPADKVLETAAVLKARSYDAKAPSTLTSTSPRARSARSSR